MSFFVKDLYVPVPFDRNFSKSTVQILDHKLDLFKIWINKTFCANCYQLYNLKYVKNSHGAVLLFSKVAGLSLLNVTLLHGCFLRFLNCKNGTKWRKASLINIKAVQVTFFWYLHYWLWTSFTCCDSTFVVDLGWNLFLLVNKSFFSRTSLWGYFHITIGPI